VTVDSLFLNRVDDGASSTMHSDDPWRHLSIKLLAEVEVKAFEECTVEHLIRSRQMALCKRVLFDRLIHR